MQLSKEFLRQREENRAKITQDMGFKQFLLRGNKKVKTELILMSLAFNIRKLHHKIQDNRTGPQLFEKKVA